MNRRSTNWRSLGAALIVLFAVGCAQSNGDVVRVQPNVVRKADLLDGQWFFRNTVTWTPFNTQFTYPGQTGNMEKVVWEIQEGHLVGYRSYPYTVGAEANVDPDVEDLRHHRQVLRRGGRLHRRPEVLRRARGGLPHHQPLRHPARVQPGHRRADQRGQREHLGPLLEPARVHPRELVGQRAQPGLGPQLGHRAEPGLRASPTRTGSSPTSRAPTRMTGRPSSTRIATTTASPS